MEDVACEFVDGDQDVPLLETEDNSLHSSKQLRTLTQVLRGIRAFKAHAASASAAANATVMKIPQVTEASEHRITIDQIESISKIVRQRNFQTLQEFGGLDGVKDALGTDLEKGIISNEEALHRHHELTLSLAPTHPFFHLVWKEVKKKTILLVFMVLALSSVFRIKEEGLHDGWTDVVVVLVAIGLQVFFASVHKYWNEKRARKKLQKQQLKEMSVKKVHVVRGGETKDVSESELVYGDILLLNKGCQVPADGLFVDGEDLELEYGSESYITNKQKPFLSYGERVINGDAKMVVTSTYMMMIKAKCDADTRFKLEAHFDKMNTCMHYIRIVTSLLVVILLFLRCVAGKTDDDSVYRPESMAEPSRIRSFSNIFGKIINESKYTTKGLTKLLSVSLVGLTEGVPFVVSLAIVYWNEETLSDKATEQDPHGMLKMASVTKICTDTFGEFSEDDTEVQKLFIGGEFISEGAKLSINVVEALCDGLGTSKENAYLHGPKYKLGLKSERMKQMQHFNGTISKCTHYYNMQGEKVAMNDTIRRDFRQVNDDMECMHNLNTVAVACKEAEDMILVGLLGLKNKNKEATKAAVKACRESGIEITIVSCKKLQVLKHISLQHGLRFDPQHSLQTGEDFRNCTDNERHENINKIRVLGEAFSSDKLLLVDTLRENGEVVVFIGERTDEAPALLGADVGIAMGNRSSEKARESSDVIVWDGSSLAEVINMVHSGKCIYQNIQSFLQPVLITTISSTLMNFIQTAAWGDASLTIAQSVYVNLAVLFLGGFALLTKASEDKQITCGRSLITAHMTRNILVQVLYQVTCLVVIQTKGAGVVGANQNMKTVVSNVFIVCQFFNLFNAREVQKKNFFRSIHGDKLFWAAILAFIVLHATFVMVQDVLGYGSRLNWKLWAGCVLVGVLSWLVDWSAKCISCVIQGIFR